MKAITQEAFQTALGDQIRRLREARGWSQRELGRKAGVHRNSILRYEAGADIPVVTCMRLCAALGTPMIDVLEAILPDARRRIAEANGVKLAGTKK